MSIEFFCPHCDKFLKTADDKAGLQANCPGCGEVIQVPQESTLPPTTADLADDGPAPPAPPDSPSSEWRTCPMCGEQIQAADTRCRYCGEAVIPERPHRAGGGKKPHRGGLVLALGLLSFVFCCGIGLVSGIVAIVFANQDLKEMQAGTMDPIGQGQTSAGRILAIIGLSLSGLITLAGIFFQFLGILLD